MSRTNPRLRSAFWVDVSAAALRGADAVVAGEGDAVLRGMGQFCPFLLVFLQLLARGCPPLKHHVPFFLAP